MSDTIFMIHGMWGGAWQWDKYVRFFEEKGYQCIAATLRFHDMDPRSAPHPQLGATSLLDYVTDLEREVLRLDVEPILMGHSMGGLLSQVLASRGLAKAAVLLTPAAPAGVWSLRPSLLRSFGSAFTGWGFWGKPMRLTYRDAVYSMLHLLAPEQRKAVYDRFVYESGRAGSEIGFWFLDCNRAAAVDESSVTCPVLVIAGAEDRIAPRSVVRRVAAKYRASSTYKEFVGHAHWVIGESGWRDVAEYVASWLGQVLE